MPTSLSVVNAVADVASSAEMPSVAAVAWTLRPAAPPSIVRRAAEAPPASALRVISAWSGPGSAIIASEASAKVRRFEADMALSVPLPTHDVQYMSSHRSIDSIYDRSGPPADPRCRRPHRLGHRRRQGTALLAAVAQPPPRPTRARNGRPATAAGRARDPSDARRSTVGRARRGDPRARRGSR